MWFRRDLRLSDNPALLSAAASAGRDGVVAAAYCLDDRLLHPAGPARRAFLLRSLRALDESIGGRLVVRRGDPESQVVQVASDVGARSVHVSADFGPYGAARDERVERALADRGMELVRTGSPYAVAPGTVRTAAGAPYKVFGPFARAWRALGWDRPQRAPQRVRWAEGLDGDALPAEPTCSAALPGAGEEAAKRAARRFWDTHLDQYATGRNDPGADATSRLSPHLRWGTIHPRQLLGGLGRSKSADAFRTELCWREFYADVLHHRPDSARQSLQPAMRSMQVDSGRLADERFAAWAAGRTGYPFVDAGMRQLLAEAWMHNRLRMVVASFLVKDLHVDWTRGAAHFMHHLVDGDLASNQHGWQWTAGTGTDPAPYVRVFNPVTQGQRFDPDGTYVRRWVPELRAVPPRHIHRPWEAPGGPPVGYPPPIVDHASERAEALARYEASSRAGGSGAGRGTGRRSP
ncbi:MAG: deoxyribodipyrimidine photo-lyase [Actinobacteria bacterium]|nr:deoxyribodipyrimidine photo-lyase [Actinomycetota bacterium]